MPAIEGYKHLARDQTHRGGVPRIASHTLPVHGVVEMYRSGMTAEEIAVCYEDLPLDAVLDALRYATDHPAEIQGYIDLDERTTSELLSTHIPHPKIRETLERGPVLP